MNQLYENVLLKKSELQAAQTAFRKAEGQKKNADIKYSAGLLSQEEYLTEEMNYISRQQATRQLTWHLPRRWYLWMGSYGNYTVGFKDKNLGYKIGIQAAPERALNLKDIYVKMQACVLWCLHFLE